MKTKTYWKIHSWLGLIAGIPLLIIAFSGSLLVFKDEINRLLMPEQCIVEPSESGRLGWDALYAGAKDQLDDFLIAGWAIYEKPEQADFLYVIEKGTHEWLYTHLDPYSGKILMDPRSTDSDLMGWTLELHYTLLGGHWGMLIVGLLAILLCALGMSGFFIYKKFWKNFFKFKWRSSLQQFSGHFHKRLGIISSPVFLILGVTGGWWNLSHVWEDGLGNHEEQIVNQIHLSEDFSFDRAQQNALDKIENYKIHYIAFPRQAGKPVGFYGALVGQSSLRSIYGSYVGLDAQTGEILSATPITEASGVQQFLDTFRPLHYGTFGGLFTKIVWCVLGAAPGVLAISGFIVYAKRAKPFKPKHLK